MRAGLVSLNLRCNNRNIHHATLTIHTYGICNRVILIEIVRILVRNVNIHRAHLVHPYSRALGNQDGIM